MKPPTKFEIMRINRGFQEYVNRKAELIAQVDSCELHVLRTLRHGQKEEEYQAAERMLRELPAQEPAPAGKVAQVAQQKPAPRRWRFWPFQAA